MTDTASLAESIFIYGLRDPETRKIHYVGQCQEPSVRLRRHLCGSPRDIASPKGRWIKSLTDRSLKPEMCILEVGRIEDADRLERQWILTLAGRGEPLVNVANHPRPNQWGGVEMLTASQVAEEKGVSRQAVATAIREGRLPATRVGRFYVVRRGDLGEWIPIGHRPRK